MSMILNCLHFMIVQFMAANFKCKLDIKSAVLNILSESEKKKTLYNAV